MNTDDGWVLDYNGELPKFMLDEVRASLSNVKTEQFNRFIEKVKHPVAAFLSQKRVRHTIPDAKDQDRYLSKLESTIDRLGKWSSELSVLLEDAPLELRREASEAGAAIHVVQAYLDKLMPVVNELSPSKAKYRPELDEVISIIAAAFRTELGVEPAIRAFNVASNVPDVAPTADRFVPVTAKLLNYSEDYIYRKTK